MLLWFLFIFCGWFQKILPSFSKETVDALYSVRYSSSLPLDTSKLSWMPPVSPVYAPSSITPFRRQKNLKSRENDSAHGHGSIYCGYLKHLPCTHHFLATLSSKILLSGISPPFLSSNITLIHKSGSTSDPFNFRMIALSSFLLEKLFTWSWLLVSSLFFCPRNLLIHLYKKFSSKN